LIKKSIDKKICNTHKFILTKAKEYVMKENWIQKIKMKTGALRKALKIKEGEKIPESKLKKAEQSKSPLMAKRAHLAETLKKIGKK
jgi:hypothetical protein